jgi:hypothetical protein
MERTQEPGVAPARIKTGVAGATAVVALADRRRAPSPPRAADTRVPVTSAAISAFRVDPEPGAQLHWRILVNGEVVRDEPETLEQALEAGYGFFLQAEFDEYASATALD